MIIVSSWARTNPTSPVLTASKRGTDCPERAEEIAQCITASPMPAGYMVVAQLHSPRGFFLWKLFQDAKACVAKPRRRVDNLGMFAPAESRYQ